MNILIKWRYFKDFEIDDKIIDTVKKIDNKIIDTITQSLNYFSKIEYSIFNGINKVISNLKILLFVYIMIKIINLTMLLLKIYN